MTSFIQVLCYKQLFFFWLTVYQGYAFRTGAKGAIAPVNFVKEAQIAPVNQTPLNKYTNTYWRIELTKEFFHKTFMEHFSMF